MESLLSLLEYLDPTPILNSGFGFAQWFGGLFSGVLLLLAVGIRTVQLNIEQLNSNPRWGVFIKDAMISTAMLVSYAVILNLFVAGFNVMYEVVDNVGGFEKIQRSMDLLIDKILKGDNEEDDAPSLLTNPGAWVPYGIYLFSLALAVATSVLLRIAQALVLVAGYWWGLIAIPTSLIGGVELLKGWAIFLGTALFWPIVEGFFILLFGSLFVEGVAALEAPTGYFDKQIALGKAYFLFAVLNFVIWAVLVAAPFVAYALLSNSGRIGGVVMPFVGAAAATASAAWAITRQGGKIAKQAGNKENMMKLGQGLDKLSGAEQIHNKLGDMKKARQERASRSAMNDYVDRWKSGSHSTNTEPQKKVSNKSSNKLSSDQKPFDDGQADNNSNSPNSGGGKNNSSSPNSDNRSSDSNNNSSAGSDNETRQEKPQHKSNSNNKPDKNKNRIKKGAAASQMAGDSDEPEESPEKPIDEKKLKKQRQARRGAMINRNKNLKKPGNKK